MRFYTRFGNGNNNFWEKKLATCRALSEVANEKATSKDDWILMCRFLLTKISSQG